MIHRFLTPHRFGLVFAYALTSNGRHWPLSWTQLDPPPVTAGSGQPKVLHWIHLDLRHGPALRWLECDSGLDALSVETLSAKTVYPHLSLHRDQLLLILKGANFAPGAPPEELISLRLFCDGRRLISCRREPVRAVTELRERALSEQIAPDPGIILTQLAENLLDPMDRVVLDLLDKTHSIGHAGDSDTTENLVARLAHLRRSMIRIRTHLSRQRHVLTELGHAQLSWFHEEQGRAIGMLAGQLKQHLSSLDAAQDITAITQDEILQRSSERTERRLFSLTVITAIFLPLTFITGLLGVNLAGIPDANDPWSFLMLCLLLATIVALQLWYLRKKNWL